MKLSAPPKKVKSALSKVTKNKVTKKREKDGLGKKSQAWMELAAESLPTPEKKIVAKSLKNKKPAGDSPVVSKPTKAKKKNVGDSPVVTKSAKAKKMSVAVSPVVSKSAKAKKITVADSPVVVKSVKSKKKNAASPVADKSSKQKKKKVAESPHVVKSSKKMSLATESSPVKPVKSKKKKPVAAVEEDKPVVVSPPSNVSLQKPIKPSKKSRLAAKKEAEMKRKSAGKSLVAKNKLKAKKAASKARKAAENTVLLDENLLEDVCSSALKLINKTEEDQEKKDLFGLLGQPINLQINLFKVPETPSRILRCEVPNPIYTGEPDVLLIVPDIKRGRFRDVTFARHTQEYEEKLSEAGIKGVKQVIPYTQLRAEYSQFEMKRRLVNSFDILLCDGRVEGPCSHFLASALKKCNKTLTPIKAVKADMKINEHATDKLRDPHFVPGLQKLVDKARYKVTLKVNPKGATYSLVLGNSQFSKKQLADNVKKVWRFLHKALPGGMRNIQTAYLKGAKTLPVPVYASLEPPSAIPAVKPRAVLPPVEDELSTYPGHIATVDAFGNVKIRVEKSKEDIQFINSVYRKRSTEDPKDDPESKRIKTDEDPEEIADAVDSDDDYLEHMTHAAAAEESYLTQLAETAEQEELEKPKNKKKKKNKKGPKKQEAA